jgi:hypothetical protein
VKQIKYVSHNFVTGGFWGAEGVEKQVYICYFSENLIQSSNSHPGA